MSSGESMDQRRAEIAARIARQRDELTAAYRNLATPITYVQSGMKGFSFLRRNPWVLSVVPAVFTVTSAVVGIVRNKPAVKDKRPRRSKWEDAEKRAAKESKSIGGHLAKWGGRGWKLFQLYRRIRKFVP